ncbi:DNA relaxase [Parashewanella curva]|uniref:DNA relaxase n=1 Tax=Parashewanella curva TaxID=2338552 RepID=A0A3L8PX98_9GAMM|nr:relaxase/mobilization nuclease domain-containing protein [Parashewanella curva]RLV59950.1 DNA relaxase [Parashewanella curva]
MNSLIQDQISGLLSGDVKHKSNRVKSSRSYLKKPPEVMVKVSGHCRSSSHIQAHFDYISRNGKLDVEDEQGLVYQDTDSLHQMAKSWSLDTLVEKENTRYTSHLVLSMPNGTEPKAVKQAVREFAKKTFSHNYQYVFALHTDTDSPHVHLTINNLGFDGKRLHIKKGQPQIWREQFAYELEKLGVAAEATPSLRQLKFNLMSEQQL